MNGQTSLQAKAYSQQQSVDNTVQAFGLSSLNKYAQPPYEGNPLLKSPPSLFITFSAENEDSHSRKRDRSLTSN